MPPGSGFLGQSSSERTGREAGQLDGFPSRRPTALSLCSNKCGSQDLSRQTLCGVKAWICTQF